MDAIKCLHEVNIYINSYKRDSDYKASVRKVCEQIRNMKTTEGLESDYGQLMFEGRMKFKRENDSKFEDNCYIMCFHSRILIFEIETNKEKSTTKGGLPPKDNYVYIGSVRVTNSMILSVDETGKKEGIITLRTMENFTINNRESFSVSVPLGKEFDTLKKKFQDVIDAAAPRPCEKHRMHEFHTAIPIHDFAIRSPHPPPRCGDCDLYIFGLLFMGYKCETCDKCYHEDCFLDGAPDTSFGMHSFNAYN